MHGSYEDCIHQRMPRLADAVPLLFMTVVLIGHCGEAEGGRPRGTL